MPILPSLFSSGRRLSNGNARRSSMPAPAHIYGPPQSSPQQIGVVPFIPPPPIQQKTSSRSHSRHRPRQSSTGRYESDSELPFNQRVYAPPMAPAPTSMTPHPSDRSSGHGRERPMGQRRASETSNHSLGERRGSDASSRSRTSSNAAGAKPLKGILKSSRQQTPPSPPIVRNSTNAIPPEMLNIPVFESDHGIVSKLPHDSPPTAYQPPAMSRGMQVPVRHGSTSSGTSEEAPPRRVERATRGPLKVEQIALNWVLTNKFQRKQRNPPIFYDVAWNPAVQMNVMGWVWSPAHGRQVMESVPEPYLNEYASTHTILKAIVVHCPRGVLGAAPVWCENKAGGTGVTCLDVLKAIYDAYNRIISPEDLIKIGEGELTRMHRHFERRCEDSPYETWLEHSHGFRYVDLLRGSRRRIFKGITQRPGPGISFDLHFEDAA